jgi:hypothetical protein
MFSVNHAIYRHGWARLPRLRMGTDCLGSKTFTYSDFCGQAGAPSCLCLLSLAERWSSCLLPLVWTNRNRAARLKQRHQLCSWVCTLGCQLCFIIFPIPFARLHQVMVIFGEATELLQKLFSNASRRSALKLRKWVSKVGLPKMSFQKKFEHLRDRFF